MFDIFLERHRLKDKLDENAKVFGRECWSHKDLEIYDLQIKINQGKEDKKEFENLYLKECQTALTKDSEIAELKNRIKKIKEISEKEL